MTNPQAKTIQIFLPTGEPRGIRIAELTTRIVQAVLLPRSDLAAATSRPELDHLAIYFLFGESEDAAKPIVYVGQTEDVRTRLDDHNRRKEFWRTAVLGISRTNSFTNAHIRYLEWYCLARAKEVGRFAVNNDKTPNKPFVPEPMEADLLDTFETLSTLLSTLGYPLFDMLVKDESVEPFFLTSGGAQATGELVEDGFVVRAGSIARLDTVPTAPQSILPLRRRLLDSGVLIQEGATLRFTQDYLFNTPSGAAAAVLGRTASGWTEWKNKDKKTLDHVKRAAIEEGPT